MASYAVRMAARALPRGSGTLVLLGGSLPGILFVTSHHASSSSSSCVTTEFVAFPVRLRLDPRPQQQLVLTRRRSSFSLSFQDRIRIVAAFGLACVAKYQEEEKKRQLPVVDSVVVETVVEEPIVQDEKLSSSERRAVRHYTASGHSVINGSLRGVVRLSKKGVRKISGQVDGILGAMSKTPSKVFKGTVYRGTQLESVTLIPGTTFSDKGFLSTTTDISKTLKFMGKYDSSCFLFTIESKTGWSIGKLSTQPAEAEILFRPNTQFFIKSVEQCAKTGRSLVALEEIV